MVKAFKTRASLLSVLVFAGLLAPGNVPSVYAQDLRILTSMSPQVFEPFVSQFEQQYPDTTVTVLNKNTNAAIEEVLRGNPRGFDIFWVSSPEAFVLLENNNAFFDQPPCEQDMGIYSVFALSGLGWSLRSDSQLAPPQNWEDLLQNQYRGKIAMARPSRSGTTHMMVERFLQVQGWEQGWAYLLTLSGNLSTLTSRSFGVPDGVINRRFDIGLSIDFMAQAESPVLQFFYGQPNMVTPAQIGVLRTSSNSQIACRFISYVLSDAGQELLLTPQISRVPANPEIRANAGELIPVEMQNALHTTWITYNSDIAQQRYWAVNSLFDVFITNNLSRRRTLWQRLDDLSDSVSAAQSNQIRLLLNQMPVPEPESLRADLNKTPFRVTNLTASSVEQEDALARWSALSLELLNQAEMLIKSLEEAAR